MSGTELIMGMEDIVQHIKDLEEQNKALLSGFNELTAIADTRNKQIKKLQEENDVLSGKATNEVFLFKKVGDENKNLEAENKKLKEELEKAWDQRGDKWRKARIKNLEAENKALKEELQLIKDEAKMFGKAFKKIEEENKKLEDRAVADYNTRMKENKKQLQKMKELEMKGNARKDIIKNMFECITADLEEVEDGGFYIKRDWGHKYIDTWNEIVTEEYKDALKDINLDKHSEGIQWETDGYQFDLTIESEDESE